MKSTSALRGPYRSIAIVRPAANGHLDESKLFHAIAGTQLILLGLCAARVAVDWRSGPLGFEGCVALALFIILAASLVAKVLGWAIRPWAAWSGGDETR